jgi:hypothetical protein
MLIRSFSISYLILDPFKLRDEDPVLDTDKLFFTDFVEVSLSHSTFNPTQN